MLAILTITIFLIALGRSEIVPQSSEVIEIAFRPNVVSPIHPACVNTSLKLRSLRENVLKLKKKMYSYFLDVEKECTDFRKSLSQVTIPCIYPHLNKSADLTQWNMNVQAIGSHIYDVSNLYNILDIQFGKHIFLKYSNKDCQEAYIDFKHNYSYPLGLSFLGQHPDSDFFFRPTTRNKGYFYDKKPSTYQLVYEHLSWLLNFDLRSRNQTALDDANIIQHCRKIKPFMSQFFTVAMTEQTLSILHYLRAWRNGAYLTHWQVYCFFHSPEYISNCGHIFDTLIIKLNSYVDYKHETRLTAYNACCEKRKCNVSVNLHAPGNFPEYPESKYIVKHQDVWIPHFISESIVITTPIESVLTPPPKTRLRENARTIQLADVLRAPPSADVLTLNSSMFDLFTEYIGTPKTFNGVGELYRMISKKVTRQTVLAASYLTTQNIANVCNIWLKSASNEKQNFSRYLRECEADILNEKNNCTRIKRDLELQCISDNEQCMSEKTTCNLALFDTKMEYLQNITDLQNEANVKFTNYTLDLANATQWRLNLLAECQKNASIQQDEWHEILVNKNLTNLREVCRWEVKQEHTKGLTSAAYWRNQYYYEIESQPEAHYMYKEMMNCTQREAAYKFLPICIGRRLQNRRPLDRVCEQRMVLNYSRTIEKCKESISLNYTDSQKEFFDDCMDTVINNFTRANQLCNERVREALHTNYTQVSSIYGSNYTVILNECTINMTSLAAADSILCDKKCDNVSQRLRFDLNENFTKTLKDNFTATEKFERNRCLGLLESNYTRCNESFTNACNIQANALRDECKRNVSLGRNETFTNTKEIHDHETRFLRLEHNNTIQDLSTCEKTLINATKDIDICKIDLKFYKTEFEECDIRRDELQTANQNCVQCKTDLLSERNLAVGLRSTIDRQRQAFTDKRIATPCYFGTNYFLQSLLNFTNHEYDDSEEVISKLKGEIEELLRDLETQKSMVTSCMNQCNKSMDFVKTNARGECELAITNNKFIQLEQSTNKLAVMQNVHTKEMADMSKKYTYILESWRLSPAKKPVNIERLSIPITVRFDLENAIETERLKFQCDIDKMKDKNIFRKKVSECENELHLTKINLDFCTDRISSLDILCDQKYVSYVQRCSREVEVANNNTYKAREVIQHCYAREKNLSRDLMQMNSDMSQSLLLALDNCTFDVFLNDTIWKTAVHSTVDEKRQMILDAVDKIIAIQMKNYSESYLKRLCNNWTPHNFFQNTANTLKMDPANLERGVYSIGGTIFGCVSTLGGMGYMNWSKQKVIAKDEEREKKKNTSLKNHDSALDEDDDDDDEKNDKPQAWPSLTTRNMLQFGEMK